MKYKTYKTIKDYIKDQKYVNTFKELCKTIRKKKIKDKDIEKIFSMVYIKRNLIDTEICNSCLEKSGLRILEEKIKAHNSWSMNKKII